MNYYIQGNAAKAQQIKAAFEKLGYDTGNLRFTSSQLYYTIEGKVELMGTIALQNLVKTHPDYQELELPIEPKFKVGNWIVRNYDGFTRSIESLKDGSYYFNQGGSFPIKAIDEYYHLWTLADAKDGDILVNDAGCIFINAGFENNDKVTLACYCYVSVQGIFYEEKHKTGSWLYVSHVHPATKEQRDLLFAKMKETGYQWDADKKELRKIKSHYDISNFHAGMPVLVRDRHTECWTYLLFSHVEKGVYSPFIAGGVNWQQCIPFNDYTKHLLGTTNMCNERFINW